MLRRKFLMAAAVAAVAAAVAPATSQASFRVVATTYTDATRTTVLGSATINDNNSPANTGVGDFGGNTDTNASANEITTPTVPTEAITGGIGSLFRVDGVLFGLDVTCASSSSQASVNSSTDLLIRNTSGSTRFIEIVVDAQFSQPGSAGDTYALAQSVQTQQFRFVSGSDPLGTTDAYPFLTATGNSVALTSSVVANGTGAPVSSVGLNAGGTSDTDFGSFVRANPSTSFTLRQTFTISLLAGNSVQFQAATIVTAQQGPSDNPVPAPAGVILAATALPFAGLLRRRLRRTEPAAV